MNELTLTELDMGFAIPKILQASRPSVDHQGWNSDIIIGHLVMLLTAQLCAQSHGLSCWFKVELGDLSSSFVLLHVSFLALVLHYLLQCS